MGKPTLLIRVDGNHQIGTGHVMRCLALAQAWRMSTGGSIVFVTATDAPALEARLHAEDAQTVRLSVQPGSMEDATQTTTLAQQCRAAWIVIDGYHFGAAYQHYIKEAGFQLLMIDDYGHAQRYSADVILNQNLHASEHLYKNRSPYTQLLLGNRYLLLRREFLHQDAARRKIPAIAQRMLITLGGSDPENVTAKVIHALQRGKCEDIEATVIIGGSNAHTPHLYARLKDSPFPIQFKHDATNLAEDMQQADIALSAAGLTAWELAFMGLPSLLIVIADNQRPIASHLAQSGAAHNLGWHETCTQRDILLVLDTLRTSPEGRRRMAQCGQRLIDGGGAARVVMTMTGDNLRLRPAREEDSRLLWEWANDPEVRTVSFSSAPILWDDHLRWFQTKIDNPQCLFFIATDNADVPVGQVRYDLADDDAVISVSLDRRQRSKGYGSTLLRLSAQALFTTTQLSTIHAYVKPDNHASLRAFARAGYTQNGATVTDGQSAVHFILHRSLS